jgi:hypothetical protein
MARQRVSDFMTNTTANPASSRAGPKDTCIHGNFAARHSECVNCFRIVDDCKFPFVFRLIGHGSDALADFAHDPLGIRRSGNDTVAQHVAIGVVTSAASCPSETTINWLRPV